jgi:hypothetical protein
MTAKTVYDWVDERLGLSELAAFARHKTVPVHSQSSGTTGAASRCSSSWCSASPACCCWSTTGPARKPTSRSARSPCDALRLADPLGARLVRQPDDLLHPGAHVLGLLHEGLPQAARVRLAQRHGAAGLASVFGFSGYLLPMDELSYFATKVGLQIPAAIPWIGPAIANMLRGGPDVSEFTVQRFFALHVVVLPAIFLPLLGFHLWLVQRHGNASPPSIEALPPPSARPCPSCQLPAQGSGHVAHLAEHSGAAGLGLSVVAGQAVRSAGSRAPRHSSRVVLYESLRDAQADGACCSPGEPGEIAGILLFTSASCSGF